MKSLPHGASAIALFAAVAVSFPQTAWTDCVTDQEQALGSPLGYTVGEQGDFIYRAAQTFQVGLDGELAEVHVRGSVSVEPPGTGPLVVQIFPTIDGAPDESGGAHLTEIVPFSELPYGVFPPPEIVFDVSGASLAVETGQVLALVLSSQSGAFLWTARPSAPYADGTAWSRENSATVWSEGSADLFFRTIVCSPAVSARESGVATTSWGRTKTTYRDE